MYYLYAITLYCCRSIRNQIYNVIKDSLGESGIELTHFLSNPNLTRLFGAECCEEITFKLRNAPCEIIDCIDGGRTTNNNSIIIICKSDVDRLILLQHSFCSFVDSSCTLDSSFVCDLNVADAPLNFSKSNTSYYKVVIDCELEILTLINETVSLFLNREGIYCPLKLLVLLFYREQFYEEGINLVKSDVISSCEIHTNSLFIQGFTIQKKAFNVASDFKFFRQLLDYCGVNSIEFHDLVFNETMTSTL